MTRSASPPAAGIGLRAPHLAEVRARQPELGFLEVHSENFFAEGGAARAALLGLRADHAVSLHAGLLQNSIRFPTAIKNYCLPVCQ